MYKYIIAIMLCLSTVSAHATNWSGTSTTYGNTTYHNFHSSGIQVIEANPRYCQQDNSAAVAGAVIIGVAVGALICKAFSSWSKPKPVYQYNYYYNNYTNQYEYYQN